jgi:predicted transcriptional regulator
MMIKKISIPGDSGDTLFCLKLINGILGLTERELSVMAGLIDFQYNNAEDEIASTAARKFYESSNIRKYISRFISMGLFVKQKDGRLVPIDLIKKTSEISGYYIQVEKNG